MNLDHTARPAIRVNGAVTHVQRLIGPNGHLVSIWVHTANDDGSEPHILHIPCASEGQAKVIAGMWRKVWGL